VRLPHNVPLSERGHDRLNARGDAEFSLRVLNVVIHCLGTNAQDLPDFPVWLTGGGPFEAFLLALCQGESPIDLAPAQRVELVMQIQAGKRQGRAGFIIDVGLAACQADEPGVSRRC
jgi:hypothetical protein